MQKRHEDKNLSFKDFTFDIKTLHDHDDESTVFRFEGFASTFGNIDLDNDIIMPGAFTETLREMTPKMLWQHDMREVIGKFDFIEERPEGLFVRGSMPLSDSFVNGRVVPQLKHGSLDQMSIGFIVVNSQRNDRGIREITRVKLFEISLVTIPANPLASITDMKSFGGFKDLDLSTDLVLDDDAHSRLTELHSDTDGEAYKSFHIVGKQFVDFIDGNPVASWLAVVECAKAQILAKEKDDDAVKHIEAYYDKADRPSPFRSKCGVCDVDMVKSMDKKEIEKFMQSGVRFSRDASKIALSQREVATKSNAGPCEADTRNEIGEALRGLNKILIHKE